MEFGNPWEAIESSSIAFRPPERISVSQCASTKLILSQPGGYSGPWSIEETPYMVEPMNLFSSREYEAICFVGPARSGKTLALLDSAFAYAVTCDPGDMLIVQMTQEKARDFSKTRIDRNILYSPEIRELRGRQSHDDNTHDKIFRHGMWLKIGWPSKTQLASTDYRYVIITDLDRMPDDIDGEGSIFQLGLKRTTTFLSRGMCVAESSPGREIIDPGWKPATEHEAPPCGGVLSTYNRGDRRRLYWPCFHCGEYFEAKPGLELFRSLPDEDHLLGIIREVDITQLANEHSVIFCPHCGAGIKAESKNKMLLRGQWLKEGQSISRSGKRDDQGIQSTIASFWLGGVAAAYQTWHSILLRYLHGLREYASSGDEYSLKATINTDQSMPYLPRALTDENANRNLSELSEDFPRYIVPAEARFLTAAVDVQGGKNSRFVVQVHAHGKGFEQWIIDRYNVTESNRGGERIDPAVYPEDWELLINRVIKATYRTSVKDQELRIKAVVIDSGGEEGTTENSYLFYRKLRKLGLSDRVRLYKGASNYSAATYRTSFVGGKFKDVPLLICNPNLLKDSVFNSARRQQSGLSKLHFPTWLGSSFWDEFKAEIRQKNGRYKKIRVRNEALDLACMNRVAALALGAEKIDWQNPPPWANVIQKNSERMTSEERREMKPQTRRRRRVIRSSWAS